MDFPLSILPPHVSGLLSRLTPYRHVVPLTQCAARLHDPARDVASHSQRQQLYGWYFIYVLRREERTGKSAALFIENNGGNVLVLPLSVDCVVHQVGDCVVMNLLPNAAPFIPLIHMETTTVFSNVLKFRGGVQGDVPLPLSDADCNRLVSGLVWGGAFHHDQEKIGRQPLYVEGAERLDLLLSSLTTQFSEVRACASMADVTNIFNLLLEAFHLQRSSTNMSAYVHVWALPLAMLTNGDQNAQDAVRKVFTHVTPLAEAMPNLMARLENLLAACGSHCDKFLSCTTQTWEDGVDLIKALFFAMSNAYMVWDKYLSAPMRVAFENHALMYELHDTYRRTVPKYEEACVLVEQAVSARQKQQHFSMGALQVVSTQYLTRGVLLCNNLKKELTQLTVTYSGLTACIEAVDSSVLLVKTAAENANRYVDRMDLGLTAKELGNPPNLNVLGRHVLKKTDVVNRESLAPERLYVFDDFVGVAEKFTGGPETEQTQVLRHVFTFVPTTGQQCLVGVTVEDKEGIQLLKLSLQRVESEEKRSSLRTLLYSSASVMADAEAMSNALAKAREQAMRMMTTTGLKEFMKVPVGVPKARGTSPMRALVRALTPSRSQSPFRTSNRMTTSSSSSEMRPSTPRRMVSELHRSGSKGGDGLFSAKGNLENSMRARNDTMPVLPGGVRKLTLSQTPGGGGVMGSAS